MALEESIILQEPDAVSATSSPCTRESSTTRQTTLDSDSGGRRGMLNKFRLQYRTSAITLSAASRATSDESFAGSSFR